MSLAPLLKAEGIALARPKIGNYDLDCPKTYCRTARAGKDDSCLKLTVVSLAYAEWKCRHCLWTGRVGTKPEAAPTAPPAAAVAAIVSALPPAALDLLAVHAVTPEIAAKYKIGWEEDKQCVSIPYFKGRDVVNALLLPIAGGRSRLASKQNIAFYGIEKVYGAPHLIIAQRETDRMLLEHCGLENVIALPNGGLLPSRSTDSYESAQDDHEYFGAAADVLEAVKRVTIAVDNSPEGERLRQEIARRVGAARCWNVTFHDATVRETFVNRGIDALCTDVHAAVPYPITGLYTVMDFDSSVMKYFEGGMAAGVTTGWPNLDQLYTVMPGEITIVTGVPNNGKSEWLDALSVNLAMHQNWRFGVFSPENGKEQHVTKLVEKRVEGSANPTSTARMSRDTFTSGLLWVNDHYYFIVGDDEKDLPTLDWIIEKASAAVLRYGVRGVIIDPWNEIEHARSAHVTETEYISSALSKLKRFARNHGIHLWLIAHPNKMQTDKQGNVVVPSLYDISGSAHWANKTDNGIVIHRSTSIDDATEVHVKKVRFKHVGRRGLTKLQYDAETGRFFPLDTTSPTYTFASTELPFEGNDNIKTYEAK